MTAKKVKAKAIKAFRHKYKPDVGYGVGDILNVSPQRFNELPGRSGVVEEFKAVTVRETKE